LTSREYSDKDVDQRDLPSFHVRIVKTPRTQKPHKTTKQSEIEKTPPKKFPTVIKTAGYEPQEDEYPNAKHTGIFGTIPSRIVKKLDKLRRPQLTLKQLFQSGNKDIIFLGEPGHGKTETVILFSLDEVFGDKKRYVLSLLNSRGAGYTQQQKFNKFSRMLSGGSLHYQLYHKAILLEAKTTFIKQFHNYPMWVLLESERLIGTQFYKTLQKFMPSVDEILTSRNALLEHVQEYFRNSENFYTLNSFSSASFVIDSSKEPFFDRYYPISFHNPSAQNYCPYIMSENNHYRQLIQQPQNSPFTRCNRLFNNYSHNLKKKFSDESEVFMP